MKNLVMASTILLAGLTQACIISSDDDAVSPCGDFASGACVDIIVNCPAGATGFTVEGLGAPESESCDVGEIAILVDAAAYDLIVTPESADFSFVSETDSVVANELETNIFEFSFPTDGFMAMTWTIDDQAAAAGCADLNSNGVSSLATVAGSTQAFEDVFACEDGTGVTSGLPLDDYVVVFALLNDVDESLADSEPRNVTLAAEAQLEDLGNFNFVTL